MATLVPTNPQPAAGAQEIAPTDEDFAVVLARFACDLSLACAAVGSSAPVVAEARGLAAEWGGAAQASVLAFGDKVPAHHAAWVNGTMSCPRPMSSSA